MLTVTVTSNKDDVIVVMMLILTCENENDAVSPIPHYCYSGIR
jgi:hypothetical protein